MENRLQATGHKLRVILFAALLGGGFLAASTTAPPIQAQVAPNPKLDSVLIDEMNKAVPGSSLEVIVVFSDLAAAPRVAERSLKFYQMRVLPMAGALVPVDPHELLTTRMLYFAAFWSTQS